MCEFKATHVFTGPGNNAPILVELVHSSPNVAMCIDAEGNEIVVPMRDGKPFIVQLDKL